MVDAERLAMIDIHIHVLPGLDDGARDMAEAVEMCRLAAEDGCSALVAAPHMLDGMYDVDPGEALSRLEELRAELGRHGLKIAVESGADVHLALDLPERVRSGQAPTVAGRGLHLMVELPSDVMPEGLSETLFGLRLANVTPIISHPERNREVQESPDCLLPLVEEGNLTQITAGSLLGDFGEGPERCATELLRRHLAHFVASDAHSAVAERRPPGLSRARKQVEELLSRSAAEDVFDLRPAQLIAGEAVSVPDPIAKPKKRWWFW